MCPSSVLLLMLCSTPISIAESSTALVVPRSAAADGTPEVASPDGRTRGHTLGVPGTGLAGLVYTGHETTQLADSFQLSQQGTEPGSFQLDSFSDSVSGRCRGSGGLQGSVQGRHGLADLSQYSFSHESSTLADGGFPMEEEGEELEEVCPCVHVAVSRDRMLARHLLCSVSANCVAQAVRLFASF